MFEMQAIGSHDEDEPYPWLGDALIAVAIVAVCSVVYFWGVA